MDNSIYRWVKASERLPESWKKVFLIVNGMYCVGEYDENKKDFLTPDGWTSEPIEYIEWLCKITEEAICSHCGDPIEHPLCRNCEIQLTLPTDEY